MKQYNTVKRINTSHENGDLQTHHQYPSASSLDDLSLTNAEFTVHTRSYNQLAPERHDEALSQVGIGTVNSGHTSQLALETRWYPKKGSVSLALAQLVSASTSDVQQREYL